MLARLWMATFLAGASLSAALLLAVGAQGTPRARAAVTAAQCSRTQQLAYVATNFPGEKGMVWFAAANGGERRRLFRAATPELSPDGAMVAVTEFGHAAGLGIFTVCGGRVGEYFSAHDGISGIVWSPDSSLVAVVVDPHPNGSAFGQRLVVIDVATGHVTTVATGFLNGWGGPSFSPPSPHQPERVVGCDRPAQRAADPWWLQRVSALGAKGNPLRPRAQLRRAGARADLQRSLDQADAPERLAGGAFERRPPSRRRGRGLWRRLAVERQPRHPQSRTPVRQRLCPIRHLPYRRCSADRRIATVARLRRKAQRERDGAVRRRQTDEDRLRHQPELGG